MLFETIEGGHTGYMRGLMPLLVVSSVLTLPASAAGIDPKTLVLHEADVPAGFRLDRAHTGVRTNAADAKREPRLVGLFRRWKHVIAYESEFDRGEAKIESRVDLLAARGGARQMLDWYDLELRKAGLKGLRRVAGSVGDQAWIYGSPPPASVTIVAWRYDRVFAGAVGQGIPSERTLKLARRQQQRVVAALR